MHPFFIYLRNAILGALLGIIATYAAVFVCDYLVPFPVLASVFAVGLTPVGIVLGLFLAFRTVMRAKQTAAPPDKDAPQIPLAP